MTFRLTSRQLRRRRRHILLAMAVALACLLVLHNPTGGYQTTAIHYDPWPLPGMPADSGVGAPYPCDPPTAADRDALASQEKFFGKAQGQCREESLGFFGWRSRAALVDYFETIRKLLAIGGAILFVGLAAIWVLGDPKLRQPEDFTDSASAPRGKTP